MFKMLKEKCIIFSSNESLDKGEVHINTVEIIDKQKHRLECVGRVLKCIVLLDLIVILEKKCVKWAYILYATL